VAIFPYLILYDTMARGYSLLVLFSVCVGILGLRFGQQPSTTLCLLMSLVVALGLFTMPTFLFPAVGLLAWVLVILLIRRHELRWILTHFVVPCGITTLMLTGFLYTPTILASNGIHTLTNNRFVKGIPWPEFLHRLPDHALRTVRQLSRDVPQPLLFAGLFLFAIGLYLMIHRRRWSALALIPALVLFSAAVLLSKHAIPYERTWIYFLPFSFMFVDAGFDGLTKFCGLYARVLVLLLAASSAILLMNHNVVSSYPDTGCFPEASVVVDLLSRQMHCGDEVAVKCPADAPVRFYMWYDNVPNVKPRSEDSFAGQRFFVVKKSRYSIDDITKDDARMLVVICV